jgi:hypothetical protein
VATWLLAANNQCRNGNSEATASKKPSGESFTAAPTFQVTVCKVWATEVNRHQVAVCRVTQTIAKTLWSRKGATVDRNSKKRAFK